jgi:hypothetical protein
MRGDIPPLRQYAFMARYSVKAQGQLYLYVQLLFKRQGNYQVTAVSLYLQ